MAKRIVDEEMRFSIIVNGNQAQKELFDIEKSTRKLTQTNKDLRAEQARLIGQGKKNTEAYKKVTAEIKQNNQTLKTNKARMKVLQNQIGVTGLTMGQLSKKATQLRLQLRNMVPGSGQYKKLQAELKAVSLRMNELRGNAKATKLSIGSIANGFSKYAALGASVIAAGTGIILSLQKMIDYNGKLADAQSNVQKTTGLTKDEVNELTKSFGLLKTRTARIELLKLAEEAGRLGIEGTKNIKDFVVVANQMKVALGDDLGDEQIREVGKMVKIYKVGERTGRDFKNSMLSLGSAINEVSASGANQAGFLVDYLKRQAGVAAQARISAEDNLAYAATFDEVGQSVEVSATAMNKVWIDMFDDASTYANIAGVDLKEFTNLLQTDANKAMILFLKGLNGNNEGLSVMVDKLKDLDVGGARGAQALSALASNTDLLEKRRSQSNKALSEAVSLTNEYNLKNNNLAGTIDKIKKALIGAFSSEFIINGLSKVIGKFAQLIGAVENVEEAFKNESDTIFLNIKANKALEKESSVLLKRYQELKKDGVEPTTEAKEELDLITLQLKDRLGDSVLTIDAETGAYNLNTEAVKEQIKAKRLLADNEAAALGSRLKNAQDTKSDLQEPFRNAQKEFKIRQEYFEKTNADVLKQIRTGNTMTEAGKLRLKQSLSGYKELEAARLNLLNINTQIENQIQREIDLTKQLESLGYSQKDIDAVFDAKQVPNTEPKEGEVRMIAGVRFRYTNGKWVAIVPTGDPDADKKLKAEAQKRAEELLQLQRKAEDDRLSLMQDAFKREMAQEEVNHQRKIQDLKAKLIDESLIKGAKKSGNTNLADSYIAKNAAINSQIESENHLHELRKATILEKGYEAAIKQKQNWFEQDQAAFLKAHLDELAALGNNHEAREALEEKFNKESLQREKAHLEGLMAEIESMMSSSEFEGFNLDILTDEQLAAIKSRLSELGLSISEINALLAIMQGDGDLSIFSGDAGQTDVLGFSADDWVNTFTNIDSLKSGVEAASMAVNGLLNAWSMYSQFQSKNQQQELANFERATDKKKIKQKELLDNGFINERQYNNAVKALEDEAEKRRAELAYKQAKRDKAMSLAGAITGTASAVVGALGNKPWTPANFVLASIVGALGLAQVGLIAGTKLPAKGFEQGYYNVQREQDGKHFNAAFGGESRTGLVDKPTVFLAGEGGKNFPEMIIDGRSLRQMNPDVKQALYSEVARVKGFESGYVQNQSQNVQFNNESASTTNPLLISTLARTNELLSLLERDGVVAVIDKNFRNIKKLQEQLDKYNNIKLKNQR